MPAVHTSVSRGASPILCIIVALSPPDSYLFYVWLVLAKEIGEGAAVLL